MTDQDNSLGRLPSEADPLASQRENLSRKLAAAQTTLAQALADLIGIGGDTASVSAQLQQIAALQGSLATADGATLETLRGEISSAVAQSQSAAQEARDKVAAVNTAKAGQVLNSAAAASRSALANAMNMLRDIPLTFTSPEDEADYRQRESERAAYIAAQQAKHTAEGDLNAAGAGIGQLADAKAHGASGSEFEQRVNDLIATTEKLREAAKANGVSTEEFDSRLREDLRRILKSKGLSDAEIDARFAATPDPLEAAKAYLNSDNDLAQVRQSAQTINDDMGSAAKPIVDADPTSPPSAPSDPLAKLSLSRLAYVNHGADEDFSHGVSATGQASPLSRRAL